MSVLEGVFTAIVTPFLPTGEIDEASFARLLAFQEAGGVSGVVVSGTYGEGGSISTEERKRLFELAAQQRGKLKLIAGSGCSNFAETVHLTRFACKLGFDAALVIPPYFFKNVPDVGVAAYYAKLFDVTELPVLLYNIPGISCVPITEGVVRPLLEYPNLLGIKDSTGQIEFAQLYRQKFPELAWFVGNDYFHSEAYRMGAVGAISGPSNTYPELVTGIWRAHKMGGDLDAAQARLDQFLRVLDEYPVPAGVKALLEARGIPSGSVRLPLLDLSEADRKRIIMQIQALGLPLEAV